MKDDRQNYKITVKTKLKRLPARGVYDIQSVNKILDETFMCHIAFAENNQPFVIPMCYGRENNKIFFHGAKANRMFKHLKSGSDVCITVSIVDGLVLARSAFHHSINYRAVIIYGKAEEITGADEKKEALRIITEQILPGRWDDSRKPGKNELKITSVFCVALDEVSAKVRQGGPLDEAEDMELDIWAGVLPLNTSAGMPVRDVNLKSNIPLPDYLKDNKYMEQKS